MSDPIFTAHEGKIFRRGIFMDRDVAERLIPLFEELPSMRDLAEEIREAIAEQDAWRATA